MNEMFSISIGEMVIDMYLNNYSVDINGRYASDINFTSISGKTMNKYLGDSRELSVNFEPMETSQINELFREIKKYRNNIPITYKDPQKGQITKHFSCDNLPVATYFISDDGREFWTIPTVVFTETEESASKDDVDPGGQWSFNLTVGGQSYSDDDISNDLSISVSSGADGLSVGQCCTSTISGKVLCKLNIKPTSLNSLIVLTCFQNGQEKMQYTWFLQSYSVVDNKIIEFSGVDAMAFIDNEYPMEGTVSSQITAAAKTISEISGQAIAISDPGYTQENISGYSGWNIRTLLQYASVYSAVNYTALFNSRNSNGEIRIKTIDTSQTIFISEDNYSSLSVGAMPPTIKQIRVSTGEENDPILGKGETYDEYGIFYLVTKTNNTSGMINLICPWAKSNIKTVGDLPSLIGRSFGTEFNCENAFVDDLYPPFTKIQFGGYNGDDDFYISNANYKLTRNGIFASISGSTKSLSDIEYYGKTETELKTKVALQMGYKYGFITQEDGIYWDDSAVEENIDYGE